MRENSPPKSILLLAANPKGSVSLRLHEEEREIKERLRLAGYGKVPIHSTEATRPRDVQQAMLDFKPQIVHFCGHGAGQDGLVLEDTVGQGKLIGSEALADLFRIFSSRVECVVLNACYSQFQAEAIGQHIDYVIGMSQSIGDRAAIEFAVGFYAAVGAGEPFEFAYELGCNAIQIEGIHEHLTPVLYREGLLVSPDSLKGGEANVKKNRSITEASSTRQQKPSIFKLDTQKFWFEYAQVQLKASGLLGLAKKPEIESHRKTANYFTESLGGGIELEMVSIPSGAFLMGASDQEQANSSELPKHSVSVDPFFMSKYPITQIQWRAVSCLPSIDRALEANPSKFQGDWHPVEQVSWYEAIEFCKRISLKTGRHYRLPTEAEWEYACRAGTITPFHFGEILTPDLVNYNVNNDIKSSKKISPNQTTPVDNFNFANTFGLYDMHGNVWEWCMDQWHSSYRKALTDGKAWVGGKDNLFRISRGGSWADLPQSCRSACRRKHSADDRSCFLGFRVALG